MNLEFHSIYSFIRGPLAFISFLVFFVGVLYQIGFFFKNTQRIKRKEIRIPLYTQKDFKEQKKLSKKKIFCIHFDLRTTIVTSIFHLFLIITPIFLLAHNILLEESWNVSFPSFSEKVTDIFTIIILFLSLYFIGQRILIKRIRFLTDIKDILLFFIVYLPFLTGFLAYHQVYYKPMIISHILLGELMLVCIPFTRLRHMIFLLLNRLFIQSEYSFFKAGNRTYGSSDEI